MVKNNKLDEKFFNSIVTIENYPLDFIANKENMLSIEGFSTVDYPKDKTIHELFEEQVEKTPDNVAVVFEENKLTYKELNERANSLARVLRGKGVKADFIVGIMVERSLEMIVGIMGILKAGGAYLPIDPNYPKARIEYMLKDSESKILLSSNNLLETIEFRGTIIDLFNEDLLINESENLDKINAPSNLAYVIYTSGTTGDPKGVMIEHKQVNNFIKGIVKETNLDLYKNILCITTISFDIFGLETLVPLTKGLKIVLTNREEQIDGEKLGDVIKQNNIEIMQSTPSRLKVLLENKYFKESIISLKLLLIGGEEVDDSLVTKLHNSISSKIYNVYGPSETTIWSTAKELKKNEKVTIGRPIINTKVYIVNQDNKLLPVGVAGELCISGDGLARGYLNRPELTAEKFVDNPFEPRTKMYKTGDLARWLPDGNIEFLGRIDNQVKIRGFRIELGEIENKLLEHEGIRDAVVIVKQNKNNEKCICGYIVKKKKDGQLDLKTYLRKTLPEYMIPTFFVYLEDIPLTINGKIDKRALPQPRLNNNLNEYEPPRSKVEENLCNIWGEVLGVEKIGVNHNCFKCGADSLKVMLLANRMSEMLDCKVTVTDIYSNQTIRQLSEKLINDMILDNRLKEIENNIRKKFKNYCSIKLYYVDIKKYIVIYTDIEKESVIEYINKQYSSYCLPHYIVKSYYLKSENTNFNFSSKEKLLKHIGILSDIEHKNEEIECYLRYYIEQSNEKLDKIIISNKIIDKYVCMYSQNYRIKHKRVTPIITEIKIENAINFNDIKTSIIHIINKHSLMRSIIVSEGAENYFIEFDEIDNIHIEAIDVSTYSENIRGILIKLITEYVRTFTLDYDNKKLLYKFIILKENEREYRAIFIFDHKIFDGGSVNILKQSFYNEHSNLNISDYNPDKHIKYKNYIEDINRNTSIDSIKKYVNSNDFKDIIKSIDNFTKLGSRASKGLIFSQPIYLEYDISNYYNEKFKYNEVIEALALYIAVTCCAKMFKVSDVPVRIISNVRKYAEYEYSGVIGDFHASFPMTFKVENNNNFTNYYKKLIYYKRKYFIKERLHIDFMAHDKFSYTYEAEIISKMFDKLPIVFNFIGNIDNQEQRPKVRNYEGFCRVTAYIYENKLGIAFHNGITQSVINDINNVVNKILN